MSRGCHDGGKHENDQSWPMLCSVLPACHPMAASCHCHGHHACIMLWLTMDCCLLSFSLLCNIDMVLYARTYTILFPLQAANHYDKV